MQTHIRHTRFQEGSQCRLEVRAGEQSGRESGSHHFRQKHGNLSIFPHPSLVMLSPHPLCLPSPHPGLHPGHLGMCPCLPDLKLQPLLTLLSPLLYLFLVLIAIGDPLLFIFVFAVCLSTRMLASTRAGILVCFMHCSSPRSWPRAGIYM